jgi:hypothetical protein
VLGELPRPLRGGWRKRWRWSELTGLCGFPPPVDSPGMWGDTIEQVEWSTAGCTLRSLLERMR